MANTVIQPFGTGGTASAGTGIVNDLTTGGADKALSAAQGKNLNEKVLNLAHTATMITGDLVSFNVEDYPALNPYSCDGISIMFDKRVINASLNQAIFQYTKNSSNTLSLYVQGWKTQLTLKCNGTTKLDGVTVSSVGTHQATNLGEHFVLSIDFKLATAYLYVNGVLGKTTTLSNEDLSQYIPNTGTITVRGAEDNGSLGVAIFNTCLTQTDVDTLFNNGGYVDMFIPHSYISDSFLKKSLSFTGASTFNTNVLSLTVSENSISVVGTGSSSNAYINHSFTSEVMKKKSEMKLHISMTSGSINVAGFGTNGRWGVTKINTSTGETATTLEAGNEYDLTATGVAPAGTTGTYLLNFTFSANCSFTISNWTLKFVGAPIICSALNYNGESFVQGSGDRLPTNCTAFYDQYKPRTVKYVSSVKPQFTGQIAVDLTNLKAYIGIDGTWKQITNA